MPALASNSGMAATICRRMPSRAGSDIDGATPKAAQFAIIGADAELELGAADFDAKEHSG